MDLNKNFYLRTFFLRVDDYFSLLSSVNCTVYLIIQCPIEFWIVLHETRNISVLYNHSFFNKFKTFPTCYSNTYTSMVALDFSVTCTTVHTYALTYLSPSALPRNFSFHCELQNAISQSCLHHFRLTLHRSLRLGALKHNYRDFQDCKCDSSFQAYFKTAADRITNTL